jgi:SH3-like domain-containing protein
MIDALTLPHMAHGTAIVTGARLNVRADPHTGAAVRGVLVAKEVVTVWAVDSGWAIVQNASGLTGWASVAYLNVGPLAA